MNEFFTRLKRLFEPRPRPPAERVGEPIADRPPPPAAEPPVSAPPTVEAPARAQAPRRVEATPTTESPPTTELLPPGDVAPAQQSASIDADELAEVRAALEEVAEVPVTVPEPERPTPPPAPAAAPAPMQETLVDVPAPAAGRVGDALVLTLGTPPVTFTVAKTSATLGRGQENTIRLDDLSVSRRHARIAYRQGGYWLSDLGSMGGTWVGGTRLSAPRRLAGGDVIDIGLCRLTVNFAGGAVRAETKSASKPPSETAGQVRRRR